MSWNIDMFRELRGQRTAVALDYLRDFEARKSRPTIIMLNEMKQPSLALIQGQKWVQDGYHITDLRGEKWTPGTTGYGTTMLVPKSMPVKVIFRVPYPNTLAGRDGLFVDIALPEGKTLRLCSTHLESLKAKNPRRPGQLQIAAGFMKQADASLLAGDLNAIEDFDKTLHLDNDLKDAYLENGGQEGAEEGMTWGQMAAPRDRRAYGLGRLDKILFCGDLTLEAQGFRTFGLDVVLEGEEGRELVEAGSENVEKAWVTDHLGVMADFSTAIQ
ncbi:hypothetical protein OQA88_12146 [Cercophora sp. LCS_1]